MPDTEAEYIKLMAKHYRIRCRCDTCHKTQVVNISELAAGQNHCRVVRIGIAGPVCPGKLNYYSDDHQDTMINAVAMLGYLNLISACGKSGPLCELLDTVVDDAQTWAEGEQTPQQMGWVGQDGRP